MTFSSNDLYQFSIVAFNGKKQITFTSPAIVRAIVAPTGAIYYSMGVSVAQDPVPVTHFYFSLPAPTTAVPRRGILVDFSSDESFATDVQSTFAYDRHVGSATNIPLYIPSPQLLLQPPQASYGQLATESLSVAVVVIASTKTHLVSRSQFRRGWDLPWSNGRAVLHPGKVYYARAYAVNNAGFGPMSADKTQYFVAEVNPSELDPKGGTIVSVMGRGLGVAEMMSTVTVSIGATRCDTVQAARSDGTLMICRAGQGVAGPSQSLSVTIGNASLAPIVLRYDSMFEYSGPKVERIQPSVVASVNASTVITIYGRNFGAAEDHKLIGLIMTSGGVVHVYVAQRAKRSSPAVGNRARRCSSITLWSDEQAVCTPPPTLDVSGHVRVIVNALRSPISSDNLFTISSGLGKVGAAARCLAVGPQP